MSAIIGQQTISEDDTPVWKDLFSKREYEYLTHVINGLIHFGGNQFDEISIQYGEDKFHKVLSN